MKKLDAGSDTYGPNTTLAGLWQRWMSENTLDLTAAKLILSEAKIRCNLGGCLKNEWDDGALSRFVDDVRNLTGIDLDRWMVIEAKRQAIAEHPELADRITFDQIRTRAEVIGEIVEYAKLYSGTLFVAIQLGIQPGTVNAWTRPQTKRLPTVDQLVTVFACLARGLIVDVDCPEDIMYQLIVRTMFGMDVNRVFPSAPHFTHARDELAKAYRGHTLKRIAHEIGLLEGAVRTLLEWEPGPKATLYYDSVETVIRTLIAKRWPNLVPPFDELRQHYRDDVERKGVWSVPETLRLPMASPTPDPTSRATPGPDEKSERPVEHLEVGHTEPTKDVAQPGAKPATDGPPAEPPTTAADPTAASMIEEIVGRHIQGLERRMNQNLADVFRRLSQAFGGEAPVASAVPAATNEPTAVPPIHSTGPNQERPDIGDEIRETLEGIRHCLTRQSFRPNPAGRMNRDQILAVAEALRYVRNIVVQIAELDPVYLRREVTPTLGPELAEFIIASEGIRHLLGTDEAWEVIEGMRSAMRPAPTPAGRGRPQKPH